MRKYLILLFVFLIGLFLLTLPAQARPLDEGDLAGVFPVYPGDLEKITRGEFAALLVKAAELPLNMDTTGLPDDVHPGSWYASAISTLWKNGYIKGYPDGSLRPEATINYLEAAVLVSRVLGLPDGVEAAGEVENLGEGNWGFVPYSWLVNQGIINDDSIDPQKEMRAGGAVKFLAGVFGSDSRAEEIVLQSQKAQTGYKGVGFSGDMDIIIRLKPGLPDLPAELKEMKIKAHIDSKMVLPAKFHQVITMDMPALAAAGGSEMELGTIELEQYLFDGAFYQKITDPQTGEAKWMRLSGDVVPNLEKYLETLQQKGLTQQVIPEELRKYFHYQYLGTDDINGREVFKIGFYGRIDDYGSFMESVMGTQGMQGLLESPGYQASLDVMKEIIKTMSYWGTFYIGVEDYLTYGSQFKAIIGFGDMVEKETMPLDTMELGMKVDEYRYSQDLVIELPPEARNAELYPLPKAEEEAELPREESLK